MASIRLKLCSSRRHKGRREGSDGLWPCMIMSSSVGSGGLMKHIRTASALRSAVGHLHIMMYGGCAALRSSALVKCQSSNSESRGCVALLTTEALNSSFLCIKEARRRKANHHNANGNGGGVKVNNPHPLCSALHSWFKRQYLSLKVRRLFESISGAGPRVEVKHCEKT